MKKFLSVFACCFLIYSLPAQAISFACNKKHIMGDFDHFPWSLAKPFPWQDISGIWRVEHNGIELNFSFRVIKSDNRQLMVVQYKDIQSCEIVAKGVGRQTKNQVRAQLVSRAGRIYSLSLASFDSTDLPFAMSCGPQMMGLSLLPKDDYQLKTEETVFEVPVFKQSSAQPCPQ